MTDLSGLKTGKRKYNWTAVLQYIKERTDAGVTNEVIVTELQTVMGSKAWVKALPEKFAKAVFTATTKEEFAKAFGADNQVNEAYKVFAPQWYVEAVAKVPEEKKLPVATPETVPVVIPEVVTKVVKPKVVKPKKAKSA